MLITAPSLYMYDNYEDENGFDEGKDSKEQIQNVYDGINDAKNLSDQLRKKNEHDKKVNNGIQDGNNSQPNEIPNANSNGNGGSNSYNKGFDSGSKVNSSAVQGASNEAGKQAGTAISGAESSASGTAAAGGAAASGTATASGAAASGSAGGAAAGGTAAAGGAAAGGTAIVVIACVIGVLLFLMVIAFFIYFFTEGGVVIVAEGLWTSITAVISSFITSSTNKWKDLWGADGTFGIQATKEIEITDDMYDADNEFDLGYIEMYKFEHQVLKNAYNHAISTDIKEKARIEGWDYDRMLSVINENYPNGYEDVYEDVNYGELMAVLDFGFENGFYTSDETITAKSEGAVNIMQQLFLEDALKGSDSRYMRNFYYISYSEPITETITITDSVTIDIANLAGTSAEDKLSEEDEGYIEITYAIPYIHTYTWEQIYGMLEISPDDIIDGSTFTTYADMQDNMLLQAKGNCCDVRDDERAIYYTLQLDKDAIPWSYDFPNESVEDYLMEDLDPELNLTPVFVQTAFDTSEWYTEVPVMSTGITCPVELVQGWMQIYDAPTCAVTSTSYYVNTQLAMTDILTDLSSKGISTGNATVNTWCNYEWGTGYWRGSQQGVTWERGPGNSAVSNGRYLIAVGPGIVCKNYWASTGGTTNSASWYNYGNLKMDLVLQENATGNVYYVPVTTGDSKGHTFPYGITQTGIATPSTMSQQICGASFLYGNDIVARDFWYSNLGTATNYADVMLNYSSCMKSEGYTIGNWVSGGVVEWCYKSQTMNLTEIRNRFTLKGIIVY